MPNDQIPIGNGFGPSTLDFPNPEPRLPCVLLLDTSSSMGGAPIMELQQAVEQYKKELLDDAQSRYQVEVAVVTFGELVRTEQPFALADSLSIPRLEANGTTPMAGALLEGLRLVEERKKHYRQQGNNYYQPWVILITDGEPTDAELWATAIREMGTLISGKKLTFLPIGVTNANMEKLGELPNSFGGPKKLSGLKFKEFFRWLTQTQTALRNSRPGEKLALPSPTEWVITS